MQETTRELTAAADVPLDDVLGTAIELAHEALLEDVDAAQVGEHIAVHAEQVVFGAAATHCFAAVLPGYVGWHWAVSVARADDSDRVTVNEVVLLPGDGAIEAEAWVPWAQRLRPDDVHPGDIVPSDPMDDRLVPGYLLSDDEAVEDVAWELGLGRERVMARSARLDTATRWRNGTHGPSTAMAKHAPAQCGTCGFYLPLAGSLRAMFGACGNEVSPADGCVVAADYGCGGHSESTVGMDVDLSRRGEMIYDTVNVDLTRLARGGELSAERRELAQRTLAAVLADAAIRLPRKDVGAIGVLTPQQVLRAVREAFSARGRGPASEAEQPAGTQS